jgi:hypothetical protein
MSVLVHGGRVPARHRGGRAVAEPSPIGFRPTPRRRAEVRRPPTRVGSVTRPRRPIPATCAPRRASVRWPWLVALAIGSALTVVALGVLAGGATGAGGSVPEQTTLVSVGQGETLSELAERFAPASDTQDVVRRIQQLNDLDGVAVPVGLPLAVPYQPGLATLAP